MVREVGELLGHDPVPAIKVERVSAQALARLVRATLEATYPKESRAARTEAFKLLGVLPDNVGWIEALEGFELAQRVALSDETKRRVLLLDSVHPDHPYVRLELVGSIADALIRTGLKSERIAFETQFEEGEDLRRAKESLYLGTRNVVVRRYAREMGISPSVPPPDEFVPLGEWKPETNLFNRWYTLPAEVGPYFVNFQVGPTGPLRDLALDRPPRSTIEFFRPLWNQDESLWRRDPVPADFADDLAKTPPIFSDGLGASGLMPFLAVENSGHVVMTVSGQWAGDRWALWQFPDGSAGLMLETRWQDETAALEFSSVIPAHPLQWLFPHEDGTSTVRLLRASSPVALNRLVPANL